MCLRGGNSILWGVATAALAPLVSLATRECPSIKGY